MLAGRTTFRLVGQRSGWWGNFQAWVSVHEWKGEGQGPVLSGARFRQVLRLAGRCNGLHDQV